MVRGNQYLEFADHEIAWDDDPRPQRPRTHAARRIEQQHDSGFEWLFWLIALIALTAAVVAAISRSASATARADTGMARQSDRPHAPAKQVPQTRRETLRPPDVPRKNWRDRAEYDLAAGIRREQDPDRKLALLRLWQRRYPASDFAQDRQRLLREALAAGAGPALPDADPSDAARPGRQSP